MGHCVMDPHDSSPKHSRNPANAGSATNDSSGPANPDDAELGAPLPGNKQPLPPRLQGLVDRIRREAERLADDPPSRGDLKILARTLDELRRAFRVFRPYRKLRKVAVFGSARTTADHATYRQAVEFGRKMAEQGWLVVTGAASGIMEAGHRGAGRDRAMGLNIILPFAQDDNPVIAGDAKLVHMRYFFTRKLMFVKESHAMCLLPGGFGTLDEGLEVLTLLQTGKRDMVPVVLLDEPGGDYWQGFHRFVHDYLLEREMIDPEDLALYRLTDRVDEAVEEIVGFFRVYHSMRYVGQQLVFRLNHPLDQALLEQINDSFGDLLTEGRFRQQGPLPEERDQPDLANLPRLVFPFNRRTFGRLRQLIDFLNRHGRENEPPRPKRVY